MGSKEQSKNADQSGNILKLTSGRSKKDITKQDNYTKFMLSVTAMVTWLFSKLSTYSELGQIRNWKNNCT